MRNCNKHNSALMRIFIIFALIIPASIGTDAQTIASRDSLISHYRIIEKKIIPSVFYADTMYNYQGHYAWRVSELLRSEILMYRVAGDITFLNNFKIIADTLLSKRDDMRGIKDWTGKSRPGWSSRRRWDLKLNRNVDFGLPMRVLIDDACIVYPLLTFSEVVLNQKVKLSTFIPKAQQYIHEAEEVLKAHLDDEWDQFQLKFHLPKGSPTWADGVNVPHNYEAQAGSDFLLLYKLTGNRKYKELASEIAVNLKKDLLVVDGSYVWYYWGGQGYNGWIAADNVSVNTPNWGGQKNYEDLSHGDSEIAFILDCAQSGVVFDSTDVRMILSTFRKRIDKGSYLAPDVFGTADSVKGSTYHGPYYWIALAQYDLKVFQTFYDIFYNQKHLPDDITSTMLLSRLVIYYPTSSIKKL